MLSPYEILSSLCAIGGGGGGGTFGKDVGGLGWNSL